jgi:hypothetical protein
MNQKSIKIANQTAAQTVPFVVLPLANSESPTESDLTTILINLGLDPTATREEILHHLAATPSTSFVPSVPSVPSVPQNHPLQNTALENTIDNLACQLETEKELIAQDRTRFRELESRFQTFTASGNKSKPKTPPFSPPCKLQPPHSTNMITTKPNPVGRVPQPGVPPGTLPGPQLFQQFLLRAPVPPVSGSANLNHERKHVKDTQKPQRNTRDTQKTRKNF